MVEQNSKNVFLELAQCHLTGSKPKERLTDSIIGSATKLGLGPLLAHIYLNHADLFSPEQHKQLLSIQLTAKYYAAAHNSAINEIIKKNHNKDIKIIFLKGIHFANQYYDSPHLRLMSDIDILIEEDFTGQISQLLYELDYVQESSLPDEFYKTHQHLKPFINDRLNVWVEVHTSLFPNQSSLGKRPIFQVKNLLSDLQPLNNTSPNIYAINPTTNLHYTITHWVREFKLCNSLIQLLDILLIIKHENIDWEKFSNEIKTRDQATEIKLVLGILEPITAELIPSETLNTIIKKKDSMGWFGHWLLKRVIDGFLNEQALITHAIGETNCSRVWQAYLHDKNSISNHFRAIVAVLHPSMTRENPINFLNTLQYRVRKFSKRCIESYKAKQ